MSTLHLERRSTVRTRPEDWVEGQYGVLDLDRLCPDGPCAPPPARDAWLPEVLRALAQGQAT